MEDKAILDALERSLGGHHKAAACAVYPNYSVVAAASRLSRVLSGELTIPPALLAWTLRGPHPDPLLDALAGIAGVRWERIPEPASHLRQEALTTLHGVAEQLELIREGLADADRLDELEAERGPVKVRTPRRKDRRA